MCNKSLVIEHAKLCKHQNKIEKREGKNLKMPSDISLVIEVWIRTNKLYWDEFMTPSQVHMVCALITLELICSWFGVVEIKFIWYKLNYFPWLQSKLKPGSFCSTPSIEWKCEGQSTYKQVFNVGVTNPIIMNVEFILVQCIK